MLRRLSTLILALLAAGLAPASAGTVLSPDLALLRQVLAAPSTVSYSGVVNVVRPGNGGAPYVYRVEHRAPDLTRRTYTEPPRFFGVSEILKGDLKYTIDAKARRVVVTQNEVAFTADPTTERREALIRANYRVVWRGSGVFDGRPVLDALLINKNTQHPAMLVRIDRNSKIVLDKREFDSNGALISETRLEQVRYAPVSPSVFALPKGYAVVRPRQVQGSSRDPDLVVRDAGFAARKPVLSEGFSPVEADLVEMHGSRTVQLLYSDGIRAVSLFETATAITPNMAPLHPQTLDVGGRSAQYAEDGSVGLLTWSDGTLYYTLVGELGRDELQRFASAISPR